MKYCSKPCVCAWVQTKNATPKTTPSKLKSSERLRLTVNRIPMWSEGDMEKAEGGRRKAEGGRRNYYW